MAQTPSLVHYLKKPRPPRLDPRRKKQVKHTVRELQLEMLRIQQGVWHNQKRVVILFEGFDASGKGGAIRKLTEELDPRGIHVHPIGPPSPEDQGRHFLYRFWTRLPAPGTIAIFDRSWYGRVLVEKVEGLCPKERVRDAYREINEFESMLIDDGVDVIKFFLAITPDEQLKRFEERLSDPYKQWKLTEADVRARARWEDYVAATEKMFERTHTKRAPWYMVAADDKKLARETVLTMATDRLRGHRLWMEKAAAEREARSLKSELKRLEIR